MTEESPQLRRIRGLLAKAERTENEHERESYTQAALRLIAVHGVDEEMLAAKRPDNAKPGKITINLTGAYTEEQMHLANEIVSAFPARLMFHRIGRRFETVTIYGFDEDLSKIEFLFTLLLIQMTSEAAKVAAAPSDLGWWANKSELAAETRQRRRGFMRGYARRIYQRLVLLFADAREEYDREHDGEQSALVLASKADRVLALFEEENPKLKTRKQGRTDAEGMRLGAAAADRADLGGTKLRTAGQRALTA
jgi:hypothetical protein